MLRECLFLGIYRVGPKEILGRKRSVVRRELMLKVGLQEGQGQCEHNSQGRLPRGGELSLLTACACACAHTHTHTHYFALKSSMCKLCDFTREEICEYIPPIKLSSTADESKINFSHHYLTHLTHTSHPLKQPLLSAWCIYYCTFFCILTYIYMPV